jgi:VWFA-related protein
MHRITATLALTLLTATALAQETPTLQSNTQLVVVDVIVQDRSGNPIHGLTASDFHIAEGHTPQTLRSFDEHSTLTPPAKPLPALVLPAGTFTDFTPIPPSGALNVLLIDALNTPTKDQSFVRNQLKDYVAKAKPGTRIAIFGLGSQIVMLQGFTADPSLLKDAVEHRLLPRASPLLDDPTGSNANPESLSDQLADQAGGASGAQATALAQTAANLAQFEAEAASFQTNLRTQYTLDAFNTLAHYLAAFPGRKNLIWFSGSFPLSILPDPSLQDPFALPTLDEEEFRETTNLLTRAQVAVYPVDARGLMVAPMFSASNSGAKYAHNPGAFSAVAKFSSSQVDEHSTMQQLADETGGRAFYNTNGLADAVAKAIDSGANYYTLTYTPAEHHNEGSYHSIHLELTGTAATRDLKLSYRHGYYTDSKKIAAALADTATSPANMTDAEHAASAYKHAALAHGGPTPQDILFKVRVLPAAAAAETTLAPGNSADPSGGLTLPYQRLAIDFATIPTQFTLQPQPDGKHAGAIEFLAYVYNPKGRLLNVVDRTVSLNLSPENYQRFLKSTIQMHFDLDTPAKQESYVRLAIRDVATNRFGVVELPASTVSHLPIATYPSAAPSTQQPTAPVPSTTPAPSATPPR